MGITGLEWTATGILGVALAWICVKDLRTFTVPDVASLGLLCLGVALSPWSRSVSPFDAVLGALIGYVVFAVIGQIYFNRTGTEALGLGDAKLLGAAGAWLGWATLPGLVATASISAMCFALITRQRKLAFGPWLAMAFWVLWLLALHR